MFLWSILKRNHYVDLEPSGPGFVNYPHDALQWTKIKLYGPKIYASLGPYDHFAGKLHLLLLEEFTESLQNQPELLGVVNFCLNVTFPQTIRGVILVLKSRSDIQCLNHELHRGNLRFKVISINPNSSCQFFELYHDIVGILRKFD